MDCTRSYKRASIPSSGPGARCHSHFAGRRDSVLEGEAAPPPCAPPLDGALDVLCQDLLAQHRSPYALILEAYPEFWPVFSADFHRLFAAYFSAHSPDWDRLFDCLAPTNAFPLIDAGLLSALLPELPAAFPFVEALIAHGGERAARFFLAESGLWHLFRFSQLPEFELPVARIFAMICVTNWDYFEIIMPPIPINQFLAGDYPDFPEVFTADLLAALARSGNSEVPEFLLNGLCTLFERDVAACVSLGDWFLDRLPDFIARPNLAFLAILTASHAFKHAQLARPEQAIGMIESLLRDDSDDLVEVGLKLAATVVARWQLPALDGTTIIPAVIGLVNEGSFRVKVAGLRALNVFMSACEFARFKEFVAPEILDLVFSFFNDEGGHTAGDHGVVAILMKMMVTILERFIFTEPDAENLRGMTPMYHVLRSLTTEKDPEIANSAAAILARLGPYWIECFTGDNSEK